MLSGVYQVTCLLCFTLSLMQAVLIQSQLTIRQILLRSSRGIKRLVNQYDRDVRIGGFDIQ